MESAKRRAAQTGRLVLVHFWAPSCAPCLNMQRNVFCQPQVADAVEASYVPVKINADHFPHTCRQYGVTALPTDLILTAEGQPVRRFQGEAPPGLYVTRLNEVAAATNRRPLPAYAQRPAAGAPQDAGPVASRPSPPRYEQPNWGGYLDNRDTAARRQQRPPELAQAAPRYNAQAPPGAAARNVAPPGYRDYREPYAQPPEARREPPLAESAPDVTSPPSSPAPAASVSGPQVPPGNPPVGLDGYCPVELYEKQRWVLGNRQWGAIHRGRTYLFAGPEEQRRFLDYPDRYAPVISGDDVVLSLDRGLRVTGRRQHGVFFRSRVYLFADEASLRTFEKDPNRYAEQVFQTMRPGSGRSYR